MTDKEIFERAAGIRHEDRNESQVETELPKWILPAIGFMMTVFFCIMGYVIVAVR